MVKSMTTAQKRKSTPQQAISEHKPVKLKAQDMDDMRVIAALMQDSIIPNSGMHYDQNAHLFTILANRFCWEETPSQEENNEKIYHRTHAGLHISNVKSVKQHGLNPLDPAKLHNLLNIELVRDTEIQLTFSDGAAIKLEVDELMCHLTDLHENWYTHQKPEHPESD